MLIKHSTEQVVYQVGGSVKEVTLNLDFKILNGGENSMSEICIRVYGDNPLNPEHFSKILDTRKKILFKEFDNRLLDDIFCGPYQYVTVEAFHSEIELEVNIIVNSVEKLS